MNMSVTEIDNRLEEIKELNFDDENADLEALYSEIKSLKAERSALIEGAREYNARKEDIAAGRVPYKLLYTFDPVKGPIQHNAPPPFFKRQDATDKMIFRSGEKLTDKYTADINADRCLRAAITGNRDGLTEAEKRSVTPATGGALLAPEVSAILIDNLRQSDWMQVFQPSVIPMKSGEVKIPNIKALPTAIMHTPGATESPTEPTIDAVRLSAKTIMVLVEVANELLQDAATSQGVITQACTEALSNKLLQQVLYGTGTGAEMKGITTYDAASFADAVAQATEKDLFRLVTKAKMAIIKNNGQLNAMLYDCGLEDRLNKRLGTGELVQPSRAFTELYAAGKVMAHTSIAPGEMLFMQTDSLFLGVSEQMKIEVDPYSAFNSNNTKFRVIMRCDVFANAARMAYYSGIPSEEPTA